MRNSLRKWLAVGSLAGALMLAAAAPVAAVGSDSGNAVCADGKSVRVWTRSSGEVWHNWTSHASYWPNVTNNALKESFTGYQSTWWSSSWSLTTAGSGAGCGNYG